MEDNSEDVIFEGSPLYEYLKETCPNEPFESSLSLSTQRSDVKCVSPSQTSTNMGFLEQISSIFSLLLWPWKKLQMFDLKEEECIQQRSCQCSALSAIGNSGLLSEDDKSLLWSMGNHLEESKKPSLWVLLLHSLIGALLLVGALTCFVLSDKFSLMMGSPWQVPFQDWVAVTSGVSLSFLFLGILMNLYKHSHLVRHFKDQAEAIQRYAECEKHFQKNFRRSLKYVQEVEVLSRGYTMVNAASYSGVSELAHLQLLPLRKVCLSVITRHLVSVRAGTMSMVSDFPVFPEYNLSGDSITNQNLPEWIQSTANNQLSLKTAQDDDVYSLETLKVLFRLYKEQCSDFVYQLMISLIKCKQLQWNNNTDLKHLRKWLAALQGCSADCQEASRRLEESYSFHRWSPVQESIPKVSTISRREVWRPEVQLTTAIHSLRLHLETILSKISPLDDRLSECEVISMTDSALSDIGTLVRDIADHIEAGQMCYQETKASLQKILSKAIKQEKAAEHEGNEPLGPSEESHDPPINLFSDDDDSDEIEGDLDEQIFEAYIDQKRKMEENEDSEEWLQEKIQRRREAEDAKRLLQELSSVLTKRSEQKERRKLEKSLNKSPKNKEENEGIILQTLSDEIQQQYPGVPVMEEKIQDAPSSSCQNDPEEELNGGSTEIGTKQCDTPKKESCNNIEVLDIDEDVTDAIQAVENKQCNFKSESDCRLLECRLDGKDGNLENLRRVGGMDDSKKPCEQISPEDVKRLKENQVNGNLGNLSPLTNLMAAGESRDIFESESGNVTRKEDFESFSCDERDSCRSYDSAARGDQREPISLHQLQDSSSLLSVNPWMVSGLAAQVAKISQQQVQLSEDTFGEPDSDDSDGNDGSDGSDDSGSTEMNVC